MTVSPRRPAHLTDRVAAAFQSRVAGADAGTDAGMTTAEYAVGTAAACGLGGVLYKVVTSESVYELIKSVITKSISSLLSF